MNSRSYTRLRTGNRADTRLHSGTLGRWYSIGGVLLCLVFLAASGCAKGALWQLGYLSPQARQQWADEEKIAKTWPTVRSEMTALVDQAKVSSAEDQQRVAARLSELIEKDDRVLVRLHATQLLGELDPASSLSAVAAATQDRESDVRVAACRVYGKMKTDDALTQLGAVLQRDQQADVQIAAVRAIGQFKDPRAAQILQFALESEQPALQLAAADSLKSITGQKFGNDIPKWQEYVASLGPADATLPANPVNQVGHQQPDEVRSFLNSIKQ